MCSQRSASASGSALRRIANQWVVVAAVLLGIGLFVPVRHYQWEKAHPAAEFRVRLTDADGSPLAGVRLDVEPGTADFSGAVDFEGAREEFTGGWPVFEFGQVALLTDSAGRMTFHQPAVRTAIGGSGNFYLLRGYVEETPRARHVCVFRKDGFQPLRVSLDELEDRVDAQDGSTDPLTVSWHHLELRVISIDLVMQR